MEENILNDMNLSYSNNKIINILKKIIIFVYI